MIMMVANDARHGRCGDYDKWCLRGGTWSSGSTPISSGAASADSPDSKFRFFRFAWVAFRGRSLDALMGNPDKAITSRQNRC